SVTAVDLGQRRFTLKDQNGDKTFPVCSKALIRVDDKPGSLADIPPGSSVCAILCVHEDTAWCITAFGPSVFSTEKSVNVAASTITVAGHDRTVTTYNVAPDTLATIDGTTGH